MERISARVFGRPGWLGRVFVGGFLLAVPIVNLWALGQIMTGASREEGDGTVRSASLPGVWRHGWAEGAAAWALAGAYASVAMVLGYWIGEILDFVKLFAPLKPLVWVVLGFAATLGSLTGWALLAEGCPLFRAADPVQIVGAVARAPIFLIVAAVVPYLVALLGIWILPQALFLGLWLAVETAREGLHQGGDASARPTGAG
jgi:hypothetical protein